jgi:hypothetical protein
VLAAVQNLGAVWWCSVSLAASGGDPLARGWMHGSCKRNMAASAVRPQTACGGSTCSQIVKRRALTGSDAPRHASRHSAREPSRCNRARNGAEVAAFGTWESCPFERPPTSINLPTCRAVASGPAQRLTMANRVPICRLDPHHRFLPKKCLLFCGPSTPAHRWLQGKRARLSNRRAPHDRESQAVTVK